MVRFRLVLVMDDIPCNKELLQRRVRRLEAAMFEMCEALESVAPDWLTEPIRDILEEDLNK